FLILIYSRHWLPGPGSYCIHWSPPVATTILALWPLFALLFVSHTQLPCTVLSSLVVPSAPSSTALNWESRPVWTMKSAIATDAFGSESSSSIPSVRDIFFASSFLHIIFLSSVKSGHASKTC